MNIILIGMPGCGKSTIGVLLAKAMLYHFVDTDLLLQNEYGMSLCAILDEYGLDGFKNCEDKILSKIFCENTVIATGGSAVYCENGMENLKKNGICVYLNLSPAEIEKRIDNITTRGIAMEKGSSIDSLYLERAPLYEKYADVTLECGNMSLESCVLSALKAVEKEISKNKGTV